MSGKFMDIEPEYVNGNRYVRRMVTGENHMVCLVEAEPGWITKTHHHENDETIYLLLGSMTLNIGGHELVLNAGDYLYIPPGVPHEGVVGQGGMTQLKVFSPPRRDYIDKTDSYLREAE